MSNKILRLLPLCSLAAPKQRSLSPPDAEPDQADQMDFAANSLGKVKDPRKQFYLPPLPAAPATQRLHSLHLLGRCSRPAAGRPHAALTTRAHTGLCGKKTRNTITLMSTQKPNSNQ